MRDRDDGGYEMCMYDVRNSANPSAVASFSNSEDQRYLGFGVDVVEAAEGM